jgi:ATP phosphoribosyltransferase
MSNGGLIIAVPSKGRLQENAALFFARAGLDLVMPGERSYRGRLKGVQGVEVAYLSASEIARELSLGNVHLGVTGKDLIEESIDNWSARIDMTLPLGFGHADVVAAVPQAWIDVHSMFDLDDIAGEFRWRHGRSLKVATKYINLTRRFFAKHGIADYRIVESLGATEGAPASGAADLIVDITTTGATLRDTGLKVLDDGVILKSEAHLVTSLAAQWDARQRAALEAVLGKIGANPGSVRKLLGRLV